MVRVSRNMSAGIITLYACPQRSSGSTRRVIKSERTSVALHVSRLFRWLAVFRSPKADVEYAKALVLRLEGDNEPLMGLHKEFSDPSAYQRK